MKKRDVMKTAALMLAVLLMGGCSSTPQETAAPTVGTASMEAVAPDLTEEHEPVTILVAAAASLKYAYDERLIAMFEEQYPWITVEGTYDSSGKLQTQIEEGLEADVFMSASVKQMDALKDQGLVAEDSIADLLENKIVLIVPAGAESQVTGFENITDADTIAIGDPESVPAGQYAKTVFTNMGIWEDVEEKSSKGTNVTEVLNWVAAGSADAGIVYATDAAATEDVIVIAEAPEGTLDSKVIYPVGMVAASKQPEAAVLLIEFLQTAGAAEVFASYGFSIAQ